ncbi:MAG: hypothetical protein KKA76_18040 [Proteobacteria bacterium]|nr:hypothetical protein [Pseudomonadota bacterium]
MADKKSEVDIKLSLDTKSLKRSVTVASGSFDKLSRDIKLSMFRAGQHIDGIGTSLKNIGLAAGAAGVVVGSAFLFVGQKAIASASDLEETQGKFDVVFKGMTKSAEEWATTLQDSYILTETESKKYLSGIQDLLVPTGMARQEAGEMAFAFTKLAADLGSFNNLPTEQVILDITSALQGSSETMAKYGVNAKAAKIEQEVLSQGWASSKDDITDAMKAQALLNITMRQTADATGDLSRTSESYANQLRLAKKNVNDLELAFGKGLLPVVNLGVKAFNEMFSQNDVERWGKESALAVLEFSADFAEGIGDVYSTLKYLSGVLKISYSGMLMLSQGVQYLFEQSNRLFGDTEKAEYWAQAQVDAQKMIDDAMTGAADSFNDAERGLPMLDKAAARIRNIKEELKKLDDTDTAQAAGVEKTATEMVKVGDQWTMVTKDIADATKHAAASSEESWGDMWTDFQKETDSAVDSAEDDIDRLMKKIKEAAGPHTVTFKVEEAHKTGGPVGLGFNSGGKVPGGWGGGDRIRALLEPGEFVMRKEAVAKWGMGFMSGLNALKDAPVRMQVGGPVGAAVPQAIGHYTHDINFPGAAAPVRVSTDRGNATALIRELDRLKRLAS